MAYPLAPRAGCKAYTMGPLGRKISPDYCISDKKGV